MRNWWAYAACAMLVMLPGTAHAWSPDVIDAHIQGVLPMPWAPAPPTVRAVYAVPSDGEAIGETALAIQTALDRTREWYIQELGGPTVTLYGRTPEICRLNEPSTAAWDFWRVAEAVKACLPVRWGSKTHIWVVFADVPASCEGPKTMGGAVPGLVVMPRRDLLGLAGLKAPVYEECGLQLAGHVDKWVGGLAHELGHAIGLPHPPGCEEGRPSCPASALMWLGYVEWPDTYLLPEEQEILIRSRFIR